jgi:hypothetical protein
MGKNGNRYTDVPVVYRGQLHALAKQLGGKYKNTMAELVKSNTNIRRVSEKSDPKSWIHPGFAGVRLMQKLVKQIRERTFEFIADQLKKEGLK